MSGGIHLSSRPQPFNRTCGFFVILFVLLVGTNLSAQDGTHTHSLSVSHEGINIYIRLDSLDKHQPEQLLLVDAVGHLLYLEEVDSKNPKGLRVVDLQRNTVLPCELKLQCSMGRFSVLIP